MKTLIYHAIIALLTLTMVNALAQNNASLPHRMSDEERALMPQYRQNITQQKIAGTDPPSGAVRTMAEWEEIQALCITWTSYTQILREIVRHAQQECLVYITCSNQNTVQTYLTDGGVPLDNIVFFEEAFNSIWIRDYGPWTVYHDDVGTRGMVDWIYNRPRPADDAVPVFLNSYVSDPFYETTASPYDFVATGGNFMVDGMGTAFSSNLIVEENPEKSIAEINNLMQLFMGINQYVKMPTLPYDGIHHIDMHMKLLDEETLLIGEYPNGMSDGPQIEANIDYIQSNFLTSFGNPYKIVRIPMPPENGNYPNTGGDYRTFTNSVFINKTVLVPIYEEQYDTTALRIYEENLPGYNIIGIDCNAIIPASGALHCITKAIGHSDPLLIAHARLQDQYIEAAQTASAKIKHSSGIAAATLYYKTTITAPYTSVNMTLVDASSDIWAADIPSQVFGTEVVYYIEAVANSGRTMLRPLVAPEGYFNYQVKQINELPTIDFTSSSNSTCVGASVQFNDFSTEGITTWQWTFEGGTPNTSTETNPTVSYNTAGNFAVTLSISNAVGSSETTIIDYMTIVGGAQPFTEDFSDGIAADWTIIDNGDGLTWTVESGVACGGNALFIDNFNNNNTGATDVFTATFDLSNLVEANLSFDVAYAAYSSSYWDRLQVAVSTCSIGETNIIYDKSGNNDLPTAPNNNNQWLPSSCDDWRTETLDLSTYIGQIITLSFNNISGYGNSLLLDNIAVTGSTNEAITVQLQAYLQGPYDATTDAMQTHLRANNLIPLQQSYNQAPWYYIGTESMANTNDFPSNTVDWLLVEARDANNIDDIIEQRVGLLLADGRIVDAYDTSGGLRFYTLNEGNNYYFSVKHRNHLAVVSAQVIQVPNTLVYDFSSSSTSVMANNQIILVAPGRYALTLGDGNSDGILSVSDFNLYSNEAGSTNGYFSSDFNLNGTVDSNDVNSYIDNASNIGITPIRY